MPSTFDFFFFEFQIVGQLLVAEQSPWQRPQNDQTASAGTSRDSLQVLLLAVMPVLGPDIRLHSEPAGVPRGFALAEFASVRSLFEANLASGLDLGASFSASVEGETVVDL